MMQKVKGDIELIEALRKGPLTVEQIIEVQGHKYVSKMLSWLKQNKFVFEIVKDKTKISFITMKKEGKLPEKKSKAVKKPVEKKTKAQKEESKKKNTFNKPVKKSKNVKKEVAYVPKNTLDDFNKQDSIIDVDFDGGNDLNEIISSFSNAE